MELNGNKTYIVAFGLIQWAIGGLAAGKVDMNTAIEGILVGAGMMGLRHGIEKKLTA